MRENPFFSVIITTYNCANLLKRALNSLCEQSFKDFEVIVSDDGSTDTTKHVVDSFDCLDIKYLWQKNWGGPAKPRNNALKVSRGGYIAFLDADDWWYPKKLRVIKEYAGNKDVIYHALDIYTPKGKKLLKKVGCRRLKEPIFSDLMRNGNVIFPSAVAIKKDIIEKAGGFTEDKSMISVEDFDLWLKISRITEKFFYIPRSLGAYYMSDENISHASTEQINRIKSVYARHLRFLNGREKYYAKAYQSYILARTMQKIGLHDEALRFFRASRGSINQNIRLRSIIWIFYLLTINKLKRKQRL